MKWKRWFLCSEFGNTLFALLLISGFNFAFLGFSWLIFRFNAFSWRYILDYFEAIHLSFLVIIGLSSFHFAKKLKEKHCSGDREKHE